MKIGKKIALISLHKISFPRYLLPGPMLIGGHRELDCPRPTIPLDDNMKSLDVSSMLKPKKNKKLNLPIYG